MILETMMSLRQRRRQVLQLHLRPLPWPVIGGSSAPTPLAVLAAARGTALPCRTLYDAQGLQTTNVYVGRVEHID